MRTSIASSALLLTATVFAQHPAAKHAAPSPPAQPEPTASLPVTRVSLYKNGVGFFEHDGHVTGNQSVSIDFTTAQLNDVLQSLTAIDLNGGRIAGAGYNSTTPLEEQLKSLPLGLGADPTTTQLYKALRGARIEVRTGAVSITGRLLDVEKVNATEKQGGPAEPKRFITVVSDSGEVRTIELTPATSVRLLESDLHTDVTRYLELLASTRNQGLRHLTLADNGTGTRELHVSYISEVPIWKSTYRILFTEPKTTTAAAKQTATLQGWSVVDNTTGADWINVQLSLIAGAPQSFIQPLSVPYYSRRPEIPLPQEAQLTPQTHESGEASQAAAIGGIQGRVADQSGTAISSAQVTATNTDTGVFTKRTTSGTGYFSMAPLQAGNYNIEVVAPGFQRLLQENITVRSTSAANLNLTLSVGSASQTVTVAAAPPLLETDGVGLGGSIENQLYSALPLAKARAAGLGLGRAPAGIYSGTGSTDLNENYVEGIATTSFGGSSTTSAFDDYFAYNLTEPITIRKNESALVPILQTKIDAERVTLWSPRQPTPLRALWITNTSNLTLDRGSFSIVEDGNFGGEGLLDPIHPAEKRLLSYAVDQAVHISLEGALNSTHATTITAAKGVLTLRQTQIAEITYVVHNAAPDARTVIVEHPIRSGYTLDSDPKPEETTPTLYRFRVNTAPGETVRLHVGERHNGALVYQLANFNDNLFTFILNQSGNSAAVRQDLQPILDARRKVADAQQAVDKANEVLNTLHSDEERQRSNITALANADKTSRQRFVHDLNATEDQIAAAQKNLNTAQANLQAAKDALAAQIEALQLNEKL